jgi:hypothetical protein
MSPMEKAKIKEIGDCFKNLEKVLTGSVYKDVSMHLQLYR